MQFGGAKVISKDMQRQNVLERVDVEVFGQKIRHASIVHGQHRDGAPPVDLVGEVRGGEVVVEGGEVGVFGQNFSDVVGPSAMVGSGIGEGRME